jgi:hypothetical protein
MMALSRVSLRTSLNREVEAIPKSKSTSSMPMAFLPPEALEFALLDQRTNLYSLGALAYWVLTGRNAVPARKTVDFAARLESGAAASFDVLSESPEGTRRACSRCCSTILGPSLRARRR